MTGLPGEPVRLVVFDLDGTLVDSSRDLASAINAMLARLAPGTPPLPLERVRSYIGEGARVLVARSVAEAAPALPVADALQVFLSEYAGRLLDATHVYPGVREALEGLGARTLAVLTNKPGGFSRAILDGLGLTARFARVYGGDDLPVRKPEPGGLLQLATELGFTPADSVMVGDSAVDVRTGRAAGIRTVGVDWGFDPASLDREAPDARASRPADLVALLA
jgi:phosphoglycolate phosphatase